MKEITEQQIEKCVEYLQGYMDIVGVENLVVSDLLKILGIDSPEAREKARHEEYNQKLTALRNEKSRLDREYAQSTPEPF